MTVETGITVVAPASISELKELSSMLAPSALLPEVFRGKPGDVAVAVLTGAELGLAPMQSLRAIEMIKGKPSLKADAQVALVRRRRDVCEYFKLVESTGKVAIYETKRCGDPAPTRMSFSIEQAQTAGLTGNDNWRKFPDAMLRARCTSALCKAVYSDLLLGIYDPEELQSEPAQAQSAQAQTITTQAVKSEAKPTPKAPNTPSEDAEFTVVPGDPKPETHAGVMDTASRIAAAQTLEELTAIGTELKAMPAGAEKNSFRAAFVARKAELEASRGK